jgi:hypothetical protein
MTIKKLHALELAQYKISDVCDFLEIGDALTDNILIQMQALQKTIELELLAVEATL